MIYMREIKFKYINIYINIYYIKLNFLINST